MSRALTIFTDGACSGNPGPAGIGVYIEENGKELKTISEPIGDGTNNIAEYSAIIAALQEALVLKADKINLFTDSELIYKQVIGAYKVKDAKMKNLYAQVIRLKAGFKEFNIEHVRREKNSKADKLAVAGIKKGKHKVIA